MRPGYDQITFSDCDAYALSNGCRLKSGSACPDTFVPYDVNGTYAGEMPRHGGVAFMDVSSEEPSTICLAAWAELSTHVTRIALASDLGDGTYVEAHCRPGSTLKVGARCGCRMEGWKYTALLHPHGYLPRCDALHCEDKNAVLLEVVPIHMPAPHLQPG